MSSSSVSASASSSSVSSSSSPEELPKPRVSDAAPGACSTALVLAQCYRVCDKSESHCIAATPPPAKKSNSTRQRQATGQLFVSPRRASSKPRPSVAMVKDDDSSSDSLPQDLQVAARTGDEEEGGTGATGSTGADHDKFDVVEWWVLGHPLDVLYAWRSLLSEFLGTLLFVFMGTGSVLATVALTGNGLDGGTIATIGLAFGLAIATMVYATANLSGGHLNPAVTIAISAAMKMPLLQGFAYIVSQLLGALVGSALLRAVTPYEIGASVGFGCTTLARNITTVLPDGTVHVWDVSLVQGVFFELIVTFVLVFTVFSTAGVAAGAPLACRSPASPHACRL